jgi:hypothetical protein
VPRSAMTARELLRHVFPWEAQVGVERLDEDDTPGEDDPLQDDVSG